MDYNKCRSVHQNRVDKLLEGFGKILPDKPTVPADADLKSQLYLLAEEFQELVEAAGFAFKTTALYKQEPDPDGDLLCDIRADLELVKIADCDLIGVADGCADISVINTGMMSLCGIADLNLVREVDENNLLKVGRAVRDPETGKFVKPKDHPAPDIRRALQDQGWTG